MGHKSDNLRMQQPTITISWLYNGGKYECGVKNYNVKAIERNESRSDEYRLDDEHGLNKGHCGQLSHSII